MQGEVPENDGVHGRTRRRLRKTHLGDGEERERVWPRLSSLCAFELFCEASYIWVGMPSPRIPSFFFFFFFIRHTRTGRSG